MAKRLTARDIMNNFDPGDFNPDWEMDTVPKTISDYDYEPVSDLDEFWENKLSSSQFRGSKEQSLYESIQSEGQKKPITLNMGTKEIIDGHHRLAAMHHMNPNQFVKYRSFKPRG
jgi:hypothetical protein